MNGYMLVEESAVHKAENVVIIIRNGEKSFKLGDKIIKIQAYGKDLDGCGVGMTAAITFDRLPVFSIVENLKEEE
jgi:hypothetical protein